MGRRTLMLVGAAGTSISTAVLAITTSFVGQNKPGIVAAVFLLFSTQVPSQPRLGPVLDLYANEQTLEQRYFEIQFQFNSNPNIIIIHHTYTH